MINSTVTYKHYRSAKHRFLKHILIDFFNREFPLLFGPIMQEKISHELIELFEQYAPDKNRLKPGQLLWAALDKDSRKSPLKRKLRPVVLTLVREGDVERILNGESISRIGEDIIARLCHEAYEQGGLLSMRDLGLITLRHGTEVSKKRIAYEHRNECVLPHMGSMLDVGTTVTHKKLIIRKVLQEKKDPAVVAKLTYHTQKSVDTYLRDYNRVKLVYKQKPDIHFIHLVTGMTKHLIRQYVEMIEHE